MFFLQSRLRIPGRLALRMRRQLLRLLLDPGPQLLVDPCKHVICPPADGLLGRAQMPRHIVHKIILLSLLAAEHLPQQARLHEILVRDRQLLRHGRAGPLLVFLRRFDGLVGHVPVRRRVVGVGAVVAVDRHDAVALIGVESSEGLIDGDLLVVDAEAMAVSVRVGEQTGLQDRIGRRFDPGNHVRRRKGDLLDLGEIVFGVLVERKFAKGSQGHVLLRPDLGEVEDVPSEFLGLFGAENLEVAGPGGVFAVLDGVEKVLGVPVRIFGRHLAGFLVGEGLAALVGLAVDLDVVETAIGFGEFVRMARVPVHVAIGIWRATVGEEVHDLMGGFLMGGEVVPEHGGVLEIGLRVALLGVNEDGEFGGIA